LNITRVIYRGLSLEKQILCLVGTRPECIKMAPVINALREQPWCRVTVLSTGQHREMTRSVLAAFGIGVDIDLDVMEPNQTLAGLTARVLVKLDPVLEQGAFDLLLVQGDTTSVMAAALSAFYRRVPIGHVEAGLRTGDIRRPFPEELNRVTAGLVTNLHFAPTAAARDHLLCEGKDPASVHVTGNTVIDALLEISRQDFPCAYPAEGRRLVLVTAHRRENFGAPLVAICDAIRRLHDAHEDIEFVYPVHPNPNIRGPVHERLGELSRVNLVPPADYVDLVTLMKRATLVLTDSGGIQEEAPALGKPVLVLREETERPEAVAAGVARLVGADAECIVEEAGRLLDDEAAYRDMARGISPYGDGLAAGRIADLCQKFLKSDEN